MDGKEYDSTADWDHRTRKEVSGAVRNLPDEEPLIHILTHISGKTCQNGSRVVASDPQGESAQTAVSVPSGRELSLSVRDQEMVEVAGVETYFRVLLVCLLFPLIACEWLLYWDGGVP